MEQTVVSCLRADRRNADGIEAQRPSLVFDGLCKGHGE
jgi:hypothetical protein